MGKIKTYLAETRSEFKHVTWPTKAQVVNYTILVVAVSFLVSLVLFLSDTFFIYLLENYLLVK